LFLGYQYIQRVFNGKRQITKQEKISEAGLTIIGADVRSAIYTLGYATGYFKSWSTGDFLWAMLSFAGILFFTLMLFVIFHFELWENIPIINWYAEKLLEINS